MLLVAEKTGERIDLLDVLPGGNRQMHGIDRYVDMITNEGTFPYVVGEFVDFPFHYRAVGA